MEARAYKVGELAARTGVSVRTLHHYHEIGLLVPASHSPGGQRLYLRADVERLQRILSLRQLGLSLQEIRAHLDDPAASPLDAVERHLRVLDERIEEQRLLRDRLARIGRRLREAEPVELEDLLSAIEETERIQRYFDADQLERLERRRAAVGEERIAAVQEEWRGIYAALAAELERGADVDAPAVRDLARRARGLVAEFTGGDVGIARSLARMYRQEGAAKVQKPHGLDFPPEVHAFLQRAMQALDDGGGT